MRNIIFTLLLFLCANILSAHDDEVVSINNVKAKIVENRLVYDFEVVNILEMPYSDLRIDLIANGRTIDFKEYRNFSRAKTKEIQFNVDKALIDVTRDEVQIVITRLLGDEHDWAFWTNTTKRQLDIIGKYEFVAQAPHRMTINDALGNPNDVPIYLHMNDGKPLDIALDGNVGARQFPWLEYIDIYIKKDSDASFGAPLKFDGMSSSDFLAMFSTKSEEDTLWDEKSFDSSLPESAANHSIVFKELFSNGKQINYTSLNVLLWYATLNLPASVLTHNGFTDDDHLDIRIKSSVWELNGRSRDQVTYNNYLRVFRQKQGLPKLNGWFRGDTHLHTVYSQNIAEYGLPLAPTKEASKSIGIDWIITTDHTSDMDNYRAFDVLESWETLGNEIAALNAEDTSMILIRGQEASLNNSARKIVHFLGYPNPDDPMSGVFLGDGGGDQPLSSNTNRWVTGALRELTATGGFAYAAHPLSMDDDLGALVAGSVWNLGDKEFPQNGQPMAITGEIVGANNLNAPSDFYENNDENIYIKESLKGGQIWNVRNTLEVEDNPYDPYNLSGVVEPFHPIDEDESAFHIKRFREGQEIVNFINQKGMRLKNANDNMENWKLYFCAGTDAHGSYNYTNLGFLSTIAFDIGGPTDDNALGKLSTIAYCPNGMGSNGENVLSALHDGNIALSDGPILVQGVSTDGANLTNEVLMGQDIVIDIADTADVNFNLEYVTTPEFGAVNRMVAVLGTEDGEISFEIPSSEFADNSNQLSYSLSSLLNEFIDNDSEGILNAADLINQYVYVRFELQTLVNYGANSPQIHEEEKYHSFTNPIWIKIEDQTTPLSVNQLLDKSTSFYPNPVKNVLTVVSDENIDLVTVYDMGGNVVDFEYVNNTIDVSSLSAGTYFLELRSGNAVARKQFVKE